MNFVCALIGHEWPEWFQVEPERELDDDTPMFHLVWRRRCPRCGDEQRQKGTERFMLNSDDLLALMGCKNPRQIGRGR